MLFIESGGPGGAESAVVALAQALREAGEEVIITTLRTGWLTETIDKLGFERRLLKTKTGRDLLLPIRLAKLISKEQIDLLHTHLLDSNFYGAIASRIARVPHLATEHGDIHHTKRKTYLNFKLRLISFLGSRVAAVSRFGASELIKLGVKEKLVLHIPNILPEWQSRDRFQTRKELGISKNAWVWINVANLRPVKDQSTLLHAFAHSCSQSNCEQHLLLVGDGAERPKLERISAELGLQDRISMLGFRDDVPALLSAADGFVLSSLSESLPMSLLEASQAELLLISTDVGGVGDIISPPETGYLCKAGDADELGELMSGAVADQATSRQLGRQAAEFVNEEFSKERVLGLYLDTYRSHS